MKRSPVDRANHQPLLATGTARGRAVLAATILGSSLAGIDATVVGIALPHIGTDLHASFSGLQWTVTSYTLTLAAFILVGGTLGDRYGRRRLFVIGVAWFSAASLVCAIAPDLAVLLFARAIQGVGGALLAPASLAIIDGTFAQSQRAQAVGWWAGASGVAAALAPFLGGWVLAVASWRWVFVINLPVAVLVLVLARSIPETRDDPDTPGVDVTGAALGVTFLGAATFAIIESRAAVAGWLDGAAVAVAAASLLGFVRVERRAQRPLLPPDLLRSQPVLAVSAVTFVVYAAIGGFFFMIALVLQVACHYSPLQAGTSVLPVTVLTFTFASRSGALAQRIGPRLQTTVGPVLCSAGCLLSARLPVDADYLRDVLPPVALFGMGLATMVAPLTATALAALPSEHAGLASGVNNAVARTGSLLAVAVLPVIVGLSGSAYTSPRLFLAAYQRCASICAGLLLLGAGLAWASIRNNRDTAGEGSGCADLTATVTGLITATPVGQSASQSSD